MYKLCVLITFSIFLPSCLLQDQVYLKKIYSPWMIAGHNDCVNDIQNNKIMIKSLHFGSDLTDLYFRLLFQKYNIANLDVSRSDRLTKEYVDTYNRCICKHIKKSFGKDIFERTYQEAEKKYKNTLKEEERNLKTEQGKLIVISNVEFDINPVENDMKNLYFTLLRYPDNSFYKVKEGEYINPGLYYYTPVLFGYRADHQMLKIRVCCGKKKIILQGKMIKER